MNFNSGRQRQLALGIGKTGVWFAVSRIAQIASGVWITRRLDQQDFTLLAVIFAIQGFAQQIGSLNLSSELVRAATIEKRDLEVAWSYEFIRNLIIWAVVTAFAPWFAEWMGQPEVTGPLRLSALGFIIASFRNPRVVELRRKGEFGRLGWMESLPLLAYALCATCFVLYSPSYTSLVLAGLASSIIGVLMTYSGLPWKPRFNFNYQRARPMIAFGLTLLIGTGFFAIREHGIIFLVSARGHGGDLGYLNRGIAFSMALALQAVGIFWKVAYPHYAAVRLQGGNVAHDANQASILLLTCCLPCALLAANFSDTLITFALGAKWIEVAPLWSWLLVAGALLLANAPLEAALQSIRREKIQIGIVALSTSIHLILSWVLIPTHGIEAVGMAALISILVASVLLHITLRSATRSFAVESTSS